MPQSLIQSGFFNLSKFNVYWTSKAKRSQWVKFARGWLMYSASYAFVSNQEKKHRNEIPEQLSNQTMQETIEKATPLYY